MLRSSSRRSAKVTVVRACFDGCVRERIEQLVGSLREIISGLDRRPLSTDDAAALVESFAEGERLCAAGRTLAAGRVRVSHAWHDAGYCTPAQWIAARAKMTIRQAVTSLETARRLEKLSRTRECFVSGELSELQTIEIASAAEADPRAETSLLDTARHEPVAALRERCREVRTAAHSDEDSTERIRRGRFSRHWTDRDGAVRLDGRFAPDDGARLVASVEADARRLQAEARRAGLREPGAAYAADALVRLTTGATAPRAIVHVEVDAAAFERGRVEPGERCRIRGVGPVPVAVARRLARDGAVKVLERDGVDVKRIAHMRRAIPAPLRTALEARDPTCVVPGCEMRTGLEIDHIIPFAEGGATCLDNLARMCRFHHAQKTHRGWRLEGSPGKWRWVRGRVAKVESSARAP